MLIEYYLRACQNTKEEKPYDPLEKMAMLYPEESKDWSFGAEGENIIDEKTFEFDKNLPL